MDLKVLSGGDEGRSEKRAHGQQKGNDTLSKEGTLQISKKLLRTKSWRKDKTKKAKNGLGHFVRGKQSNMPS